MPVQLIVQLLTLLGPDAYKLIRTLIDKWTTNGIVTAIEWDSLIADISKSSQDHMRAQLVKAGIALDSPQAVALLALTK